RPPSRFGGRGAAIRLRRGAGMSDPFSAKQRVDRALEALRIGLGPYVAERMTQRHGDQWRQFASRAAGSGPDTDLDVYGLLKTILDNYGEVFRFDARLRKARSYISLAMDARNAVSHFDGLMQDREALRYLDAIRELLEAVGAKQQVGIVDGLYEAQKKVNPAADQQQTKEELRLEEPPPPEKLQPWREVVQPHADVLEARFSDAEFAA